ncbi:uncharacterized protein [Choristoneura fumiferana]|uniref:uncharacterized protein n=1 Tax=Choristoneura fumiferana TaxID=7141 RepID=UPI003D1553C3
MKSFACVLLLAAFVAAEPPFYRNARFTFQRQESEREPTTARNEEAPYAPAGFKPSREFKLPSRQEVAPPATSYGVPSDSYAVPLHTYSAPQAEYGVPRNSGREEPEKEEKEGKAEEEGEVESLKVEGAEKEGKERKEKKGKHEEASKGESEVIDARGAYYVLLPDLQLQRVQFQTQNDLRNMAYTARLQYRNEDRAPVYVYSATPQYQNAAYVQLY